MFTYIDPQVREQLVAKDKLVRIDGAGRAMEPTEVVTDIAALFTSQARMGAWE